MSPRAHIRSGFAWAAALAACGGCASGGAPRAGAAAADPLGALAHGEVEVVDLTHVLGPETALWPGAPAVTVETLAGYDSGYYARRFSAPEHAGTHVDAPAHFISGEATVERIAAADLVAPAVVVDVTEAAARDADYRCSLEDVRRFEAEHGRIPRGAVVLLRTGFGARFADAERYRNADEAGVMHFPSFGEEAAAWLASERGVRALGVDTLSTDAGASRDFAVHHAIHARGLYGIENLANLDRLPAAGAVVVVGALPLVAGSGSPARVLALVPRGAGAPSSED